MQLMVLYGMQEGENTILKNNKGTVGGGYPNCQRICTCIHTYTCRHIYVSQIQHVHWQLNTKQFAIKTSHKP